MNKSPVSDDWPSEEFVKNLVQSATEEDRETTPVNDRLWHSGHIAKLEARIAELEADKSRLGDELDVLNMSGSVRAYLAEITENRARITELETIKIEANRLYRYLNGLDQDSYDARAEHVMQQSLDGLAVGQGNRNSVKETLATHFEAVELAERERCAQVAKTFIETLLDPKSETMSVWDQIRHQVETFKGSDLPRLNFESLIETIAEHTEAAIRAQKGKT